MMWSILLVEDTAAFTIIASVPRDLTCIRVSLVRETLLYGFAPKQTVYLLRMLNG